MSAQLSQEFHLDAETYEALIAHARSDFPYEVCGLLAGRDGQLVKHYRVPNAARSMTFYDMEPTALLVAMNEMDDNDWDLLGIYHSHTHTEAYPSNTDVELAFYRDAVYLIVSLQDHQRPAIRAYDIIDGQVTERTVVVDPVGLEPGSASPRITGKKR